MRDFRHVAACTSRSAGEKRRESGVDMAGPEMECLDVVVELLVCCPWGVNAADASQIKILPSPMTDRRPHLRVLPQTPSPFHRIERVFARPKHRPNYGTLVAYSNYYFGMDFIACYCYFDSKGTGIRRGRVCAPRRKPERHARTTHSMYRPVLIYCGSKGVIIDERN